MAARKDREARHVGEEECSVRGYTARCQVGRGLKKDHWVRQVGGRSWVALARALSGPKKRRKADSGGLRMDENKETEVQVLVQVASASAINKAIYPRLLFRKRACEINAEAMQMGWNRGLSEMLCQHPHSGPAPLQPQHEAHHSRIPVSYPNTGSHSPFSQNLTNVCRS